MTCCSIASGCGIPVTGCTGSSVAAGYVLVDLVASQMPFYVDTCKGEMYYWDGTKWIVLGKDAKYLTYDTVTRQLTLMPDGSSVNLPVASSTIAGMVKVGGDSPISITSDGVLVIDCAKLKTSCGLLSKDVAPNGNVVYFNTTTNMLDIDCTKLKAQCGYLTAGDLPVSGNVVKINPTSKQLELDCVALKTQCNLATMADIPAASTVPVSGAVVKVNPTTQELEIDCAALKSSCGLASMSDIPAAGASVDWGQQATLTGTTLHIANTQDPTKGVDVDLSSLAGGGGTTVSGGGAQNYLCTKEAGNGQGQNSVSTYLCVFGTTRLGTLIAIEYVAGLFSNSNMAAGIYYTPSGHAPYNVPNHVFSYTAEPNFKQQMPGTRVGTATESGQGLAIIFQVGGLILHYTNGSVANTEICGYSYFQY